MAGRKLKLTTELQARVCAEIERGVWDYVAAQAAGIGQRTFYRWMEYGEQGKKPYRQFWQDVMEARAKSRARREAAVAQENPLAWLRMGPGRDKPGEAGWTDQHRQEVTGPDGGPMNFTLIIKKPADVSSGA